MVLLPLKAARLKMGTLSAGNNCIGTYNASTLLPSNSCDPASGGTLFTDAATLDGYITLEDADTVVITSLSESLCVLLSAGGDAGTMQGDGGINLCARDANGKIIYQGNWCDGGTTPPANTPATATCADSVQLGANFAASSVLITN